MANNDDLVSVLADLKSLLKKQTSLRFAFARGLVYGVGTVVGATILIGLLTGVLGAFINEPRDTPIIGPLFQEERVP